MASSTRGVESPISTDMALIGDTKQTLHTVSLPKRMGPNYGYGTPQPLQDYRVEGNPQKFVGNPSTNAGC
jgi:hypothetical protein